MNWHRARTRKSQPSGLSCWRRGTTIPTAAHRRYRRLAFLMRRHGERDHGRAGQHGHDAEGDPPDPRRSQAQAHGTAPYAAIVPGTLPQAGGKTFTACFTLVRPYGDLVSNVESPWEDTAVTATHNRN